MIGVDAISPNVLIYLRFCAVLIYGRKDESVNFGFIFANLCKPFTQKRSVTRLRTGHLGSCDLLVFLTSAFSLTTAMQILIINRIKTLKIPNKRYRFLLLGTKF